MPIDIWWTEIYWDGIIIMPRGVVFWNILGIGHPLMRVALITEPWRRSIAFLVLWRASLRESLKLHCMLSLLQGHIILLPSFLLTPCDAVSYGCLYILTVVSIVFVRHMLSFIYTCLFCRFLVRYIPYLLKHLRIYLYLYILAFIVYFFRASCIGFFNVDLTYTLCSLLVQ